MPRTKSPAIFNAEVHGVAKRVLGRWWKAKRERPELVAALIEADPDLAEAFAELEELLVPMAPSVTGPQ
jgi:hypothetical protein